MMVDKNNKVKGAQVLADFVTVYEATPGPHRLLLCESLETELR
jgi:hypothetical protein